MGKFLTDRITSIGVSKVPGRKKVALIVQNGNMAKVYGYFSSEELADEFMDRLADLCHAKKEDEEK